MRDAIDPAVWRRHAWANRLQSRVLLAAMGGFLALLGWLLAGPQGVAMLLGAGAVGVVLNPGLSPRWVMRLYGARRIAPHELPPLWRLLEALGERAGLPAVPALYYVPSRMLNAFAVGTPERSAIAVTDGLLRRLDLAELAAVLAHEISHVRSNDLWVMGLADMFSRATSALSLAGQVLLLANLPLLLLGQATIDWLLIAVLVVAPSLSALAQLALSRAREHDADLNAVRLTGDPAALARALVRIERVQGGWLERLVLPGRRLPEPSLLRSHPTTEERIARLEALAPGRPPARGGARLDPGDHLGRPVARRPGWHASGLWH